MTSQLCNRPILKNMVCVCVSLCGETFGKMDVDLSLNVLHFPGQCFMTVEWAGFCVDV